MAYLTEKEKCILFSAINREEKVCKEHGFADLVKVCKRLTYLFSYNRFEKDIRNKAINEFASKLHERCDSIIKVKRNDETAPTSWSHAYADFKDDIDDIAEQMKGN